ncbi:MAG TPA: AMP-binding protein [Acidobacteriaceae bacterium]|nr:AMP-binding protein [Acidobacteriaceae bacterium]
MTYTSNPPKPDHEEPAWPGKQEQVISDAELPLQKLYACERDWASRSFLTQTTAEGTREWSWEQAMDDSRRVAAYLKSQGWPPGSRIAIFSKNSAWWIMADFAIWMAGFISVPVYASIRETSLLAILNESQPVACFLGPVDQDVPAWDSNEHAVLPAMQFVTFPNIAEIKLTHKTVQWNRLVKEQSPLPGELSCKWSDVATIIYTSGTTGAPKGVMQSFQAISLMGKSVLRGLPPAALENARVVSYLPLAHIAERGIVEAMALFTPLHIFFVENQQTFLRDLKRARPTIFFTVPRLLMRFQQGAFEKIPEKRLAMLLRVPILGPVLRKRILRGLGLDSVLLAASGAAPLRVDLLLWYRRLGLNLVEGYGMTETGITHVPLQGRLRAGYVGEASPYAHTRIAQDGEVQIQGSMNLLGYYQNPTSTAAAFTQDGYFRTGDRGEIDEDGRLRIVGRLKEEFKTAKGKYVIPGPIENILSATTLFDSVCVLGSGMAAPFVLAVLTAEQSIKRNNPASRGGLERELDRAIAHANSQLEPHERLRFLVVCDEPWTTANGFLTPTLKVRRSMIEDRYSSSFDQWEQSGQSILWLGTQ